MKRKLISLTSLAVFLSVMLSSCIGLIPLEEEPVSGDYGPQYSLQEHHTRTFDTLWALIQDNYIYYETADVDWDALRKEYQTDIDKGLTAEEFDALLASLEDDLPDGSINYQSRTERIENDTEDTSTYEGIGAFIGFNPEPEPHIILLSVMKGSPAEQAGLKAHDSILAIDGNPVTLEEGLRAVERVRGPSGSTVTLTVQSPGEEERNVEVKRGKLATNVQLEARQVSGTNYGYILFPPIGYDAMLEDVLAAMQVFTTNQKLEGLILDMRIAGSSGSWPLESLYAMFYDGEIGEFYNRTNKQAIQVRGQDVFSSQSVPLVILVSGNTQGLPEILAGSLQLNKRAVIIGMPTSGVVGSAAPFLLPDGSRVYLETTSFRLSNGEDIGFGGVQPDVTVEAGWDEVLPNQDSVIDAALEALRSQE